MSVSILLIAETSERHAEIDLNDVDAAIHIESCLVPHLAQEFATVIVHRSVVLPVPDEGVTRVFLQMEIPAEAIVACLCQPLADSTLAQHIERSIGPLVRQLLGQASRLKVRMSSELVVKPDAVSMSITPGQAHSPR